MPSAGRSRSSSSFLNAWPRWARWRRGWRNEINNPLSVVAGNLQILKQDFESVVRALGALSGTESVLAAASSFQEAVADAEEATERSAFLTRDLRVFSHPDDAKREAVDVHKVLESAIRMARNELRPRATIVRRFGDVPKVLANEARLGQVFLNLLVNAAHAIPEGRREVQTITLVTGRHDDMVVVDVIDTGVGIPPEVLPRIFDIFFTTKPVGIGTGMGLAISPPNPDLARRADRGSKSRRRGDYVPGRPAARPQRGNDRGFAAAAEARHT